MSYESPITKYVDRMIKDIVEKEDGYLLEEVRKVGFNIDKDELAKALQYDRKQYEKGFSDGRLYQPAIVTNADRIRAMTDEELAEWIEPIADCRRCKIDCKLRENGSPANCKFRWLDWLKQEESL